MLGNKPSAFGKFVYAAMQRKAMSLRGLAAILNKSHGNISSILNEKIVNGSPARPALEEMGRWASALGLTAEERAQLVELAELAHTPPAIRDRYLSMRAALAQPVHAAAEPHASYRVAVLTPEPTPAAIPGATVTASTEPSPAQRRKAGRVPFTPDLADDLAFITKMH